MSDHDIPVPPNKLIRECGESYMRSKYGLEEVDALRPLLEWGYKQGIAKGEAKIQAAVDAELEACCEQIERCEWFANPQYRTAELRAARRPQPQSLKQQALALLPAPDENVGYATLNSFEVLKIRRALEALPEDESC